MSEERVRNRWIVVVGAIMIQLALGTIYSWGTLTTFISPYINEAPELTVYVFGIGLLSFAITMIIAGKLQQTHGPKRVAILGGILIGIGVIFSSLMTSFLGLLITYGILFGSGIGFAYVCPIACAGKWFPDKKGFINGIAVAGFGAGAFIFNFVIEWLSQISIPVMFIILGIIYLAMIIGGALTLNNPPEGWQPDGWDPINHSVESEVLESNFERREVLKLYQFWMLWGTFVLSAISGLLVIGSFASFAHSDVTYEIYLINFVLIGSLAALFNGFGRIFWGKLADIITYKKSMIVMFSIQAILMISYFFTNSSMLVFTFYTCAIFFCFGGNFSLFPTATSDLFGSEKLGANYGILFTAYGIAGFIGAVGVDLFVRTFGSYLVLFIVMGCMSIGGVVLVHLIKPPVSKI